jgi:hypothetical protein
VTRRSRAQLGPPKGPQLLAGHQQRRFRRQELALALRPDAIRDRGPEEAEQARKAYLLTRFWISARGYWGKNADPLAWLFSSGTAPYDQAIKRFHRGKIHERFYL